MQSTDSLDESNAHVAHAQGVAQHNAQLPATRLPPEILIRIFSTLSSIDQPQPSSKHWDSFGTIGWLAATYVCRRWRSVALDDALLWASNITMPFPLGTRWNEIFLSRAKDAPLAVTDASHHSWRPPKHAELAFITANLARTQILRLTATGAHLSALCTPAPLLHTLDLISLGTSLDQLKGLLGGATGAPALRHLKTSGLLPWTLPLLVHLTSLHVKYTGISIEGTEVKMFSALGGMAALERLTLDLQLGAPAAAPVALATLRELRLRTSVASARNIMQSVTLPATACARYELRCSGATAADLSMLFRAATACVDTSAPIVRMEITPAVTEALSWGQSAVRVVDVVAWRRADRADAPTLSLSFKDPDGRPLDQGLVSSALTTLASAGLTALVVSCEGSDSTWPWALWCADVLRSVTVAGNAAQRFCAVLAAAPARFVPALAELALRDADMDFAVGYVGGEGKVRELALGLERRGRAGSALRVLNLERCELEEGRVLRLRRAVPGMEVTVL
ncbi:hypothetical protein FA95DRAFT_1606995 [Auriscalpium vulgare]|uniref:Uncharacterized protein n=1 Tax=Auriscalpium vulgare TaxID=40419 RepID=A0ACB8RQP7_9AGAM|nr:hypothetical protein FA95DRAFT_1606995 [Auriscalpium vulgare]